MNIPVFELERIQSLYENTVDYNLTESGFHPYSLHELLNEEQQADILQLTLGYGQTNGSISLRKRIAAMYPAANFEQVVVTNGTSEANFVACHSLLKPGDEVVMMLPNYMQIWGIAEEIGAKPRAFHLRQENDWAADLEELESQVNEKTKMIAICNPNNPTGYTLTEKEMDRIIAIAEKVGAWVYADEVYRGAELDGVERPSFYGRYDKAIVNGGLSKAYALPGLRIGWLIGPKEIIDTAWAYHDYTSITASVLSHKVAEIALEEEMRQKIRQRNISMLLKNLDVLQNWALQYPDVFSFSPPKAAGMVFFQYHLDMGSEELSDYLRKNHSVFIVPGTCFGMEGFVRMGAGSTKDYLEEGLARIDEGLKGILERVV